MKIIFYIAFLLILINNEALSIPDAKISKITGEIPEDQCSDFNCLNIKSVSYFTSCGQLVSCKNCKISPEKHVSYICSGWKPNRLDKIQLAVGSIQSEMTIGSQSFRELRAKWDSNNPIDIDKCQLENFDYRKAYNAFSTGQYTSLYSTVTFQVSIIELSKTDGRKRIPNIEIDLDLDETLEEINYRGMNRRTKRDKSFCPITHSSLPLKLSQKKTKGDVTIVSKSFSIPLYRSKVYRPYEFKIRVKCEKNKNCNMRLYKFCLKISCSRMPETQFAELNIVKKLLIHKPQINIEEDDVIADEDVTESEIESDIDDRKQETRIKKEATANKGKITPEDSIRASVSMSRRVTNENINRKGYEERAYSQTLNNVGDFQSNQIYIVTIVIFILIIFIFILILVLKKRN
ncbi:hypothetical protein FG379_000256 [Cryptosporidium bovis]|uniref:uncharacterized protein n=1 Tax=Cryptosporidium bovis TaxID=310047 RepID=UPI00351A31D8|nr:hypothetical protein FG379_000256 [Cryptosporidium bovis]